jgi:hypothetical protein
VCGFLGCDSAEGNPVLATLPTAIRLTIEEGGAEVRNNLADGGFLIVAGKQHGNAMVIPWAKIVHFVLLICGDAQ